MESYVVKVTTVLWLTVVNSPHGLAEDTGLSKFWADNSKAFHHIYGKTSDLDLYGKTLPLSVTHGMEAMKFRKSDSLANQRAQSFPAEDDTTAADTQVDPFELTDSFAQLVAERKRSKDNPKAIKYRTPLEADETVIHSLKPANEALDQATIDYIKQFEHLGTQQAIDFPQEGLSGFKPYAGLTYRSALRQPPALDSYRSIQDIIDASDNYEEVVFERQKANHELAHKVYGKLQKIQGAEKAPSNIQVKSKKPAVRFIQGNEIFKKPKRVNCSSSRCRKPHTQLRVRKVRPRVTTIKHTVVAL